MVNFVKPSFLGTEKGEFLIEKNIKIISIILIFIKKLKIRFDSGLFFCEIRTHQIFKLANF